MRVTTCSAVPVPYSKGIPGQQTMSHCHEISSRQLTWQCYRTRSISPGGVALIQSTSGAQILLGLHKQKLFTSVLILAKRCMARGTLFLGGNLQTTLARGCGGAIHLWLGCPGQDRWVRAARQPTAVTQLLCVRWARGDSQRWRVTSHLWRAVIRPLKSMSGPRVRQDKSMPALPRPDGICQAAAARRCNCCFSR